MKAVFPLVLAFAATAIAESGAFPSVAAALPQARAPVARSGLERHPAKMVVTPLLRNDGKPYERVEFVAGTRSIVVNGNIGVYPWNWFAHFGSMVLLENGKDVATLSLLAEDDWDSKTENPGERLTIDRERGTATWSRPYKLKDGTVKTLSYVVSTLPDGCVAVDYDFGLTLEEAKKEGQLPICCRLSLASREEGTVEYGFGDNIHEPYPAEALIAANEQQKNMPLVRGGSTRLDYEKRDTARHWSLTFPRDGLLRAYTWIDYRGNVRDGKRYRNSMLFGDRAIGNFRNESLGNDVKGRFIWDLGSSEQSAVAPEAPLGGIDFWALDALHVPQPATRNLVMNGSFEQDFKGWRWEDWGADYNPSDVLREEIVEGGKFGRHALLLRAVQMSCPALCSAPMPLEAGETYTVSCWAKAVNGKNADFMFLVRSVTQGAKYWQFKGLDEFPRRTVTGADWQRVSFSFVADAGGFFVQIAPGHSAGREGVLIDGVQVEKAKSPSDYTEPDFVANLTTSNPYNDLKPGDPIDAALEVQSLKGAKGAVNVRVFNGYYEQVYERSFPLALAKGGMAKLKLDFDPAKLGRGLFIVRMDYAVMLNPYPQKSGKTAAFTDYTRFIIQQPLANRLPTSQLYANHCRFYRVSRAPHYLKKFVEWGWGSTDGRRNNYSVDHPLANEARALGIRNYVHSVAYEGRLVEEMSKKPLPSGARVPKQGWLTQTGTPEELELFEVCAYEAAMKCLPEDDIWTFSNEEEAWVRGLGDKGFEVQFAFNAAIQRGVRRAFKERGLPPPRFCESHGTSHYFNGRNYDMIDGYLKTALAHGCRYDVVAIHPYSNIDGGTLGPHDADAETQHLIDTMAKYGYPESAKIMFTECFNMQPWRFPSWRCDGWGDQYRANTTPSHDCGNREFVMAASQMRLYIIALKYWPKVQLVHPWNRDPFVDLRFTPLMFTFSANTLGNLLPSPSFVGDAQPYGDVRGYCFRQGDKAVMPVWTTNHDVENGEKKSPVLEMTLPSDTVFVDMFCNKREPLAKDVIREGGADRRKTVKVPLTPAPLFLVSKDAEGLLKALREAVADDPSTALAADVRPEVSGALNLTLENLTKAPRKGVVKVGNKDVAYDLPPRGKSVHLVGKGDVEPMVLKSWKKTISPLFPKPWDTKWFYVPKCGERPDWPNIPAMPLATAQGAAAKGFKASCKYAWNKDCLFIRVEAEDPEFIPAAEDGKSFVPSCLYAHDGCLEVYFDGFADARSQGTNNYDENDSRYDFLEDHVHRLKAVNWQLAQGTASATDDEIKKKLVRKFTRTEKGYVYELAFAARYMAPVELKAGTVAGTGLCLHEYWRDADGKMRHASVSDATLPGYDCDQKPWVWPLMVLKD